MIDRAAVFGAGRSAYHGCSVVIFKMLGSVEVINAGRNTVEHEKTEDEEVRGSVRRQSEHVK